MKQHRNATTASAKMAVISTTNNGFKSFPNWEMHNGDSELVLKKYPDNYFHSVVCDPPYGLSRATRKSDFVIKILQAWLAGEKIKEKGKGIADAEWDFCVPPPSLWKEVYRVMKPGAYLAAFGSPRTDGLLKIGLQIAGFEIIDTIAFIHHEGFPKHQDASKTVETHFRSWGYTPPESHNDNETIMLKVSEKTKSHYDRNIKRDPRIATIIMPSDDRSQKWCDYKTELKAAYEPIVIARKPMQFTLAHNLIQHGCGAMNIGACRVPLAKGEKPSKQLPSSGRHPANVIGDFSEKEDKFFKPFSFDNPSFMICPKPNDEQVNRYMPIGEQNNHPTPKNIELMKWLTRLVTPAGGKVLDPFAGTGTGGIAAIEQGFEYVGIELDHEYHRIAKSRLENMAAGLVKICD